MYFSSNKPFLIVYAALFLCAIVKSAEVEKNPNIDQKQTIINNNNITTNNATETNTKIKVNETNKITTEPKKSQSSDMQNFLHSDDDEIPNSIRVGFYIFIGLGVLSIFFIIFRSYRLRLSRAERKYGVQGDRGAQELTPLPMAIEEDSENDDQTLFEINRQARVS